MGETQDAEMQTCSKVSSQEDVIRERDIDHAAKYRFTLGIIQPASCKSVGRR
jgi:hypothetical protein